MSERPGWDRVNDLRTLIFGLPLGTKLTADLRLDIAGHLNELVDYTNRLETSHVALSDVAEAAAKAQKLFHAFVNETDEAKIPLYEEIHEAAVELQATLARLEGVLSDGEAGGK